jgi:cob(I)alamin adenosyltransferase
MANRLTQIATRTGDDGTTGLGDGTRVPKDHLRVPPWATSTSSTPASACCWPSPLPDDVRELLVVIQHELFNLGGELSIPGFELLKAEAVARLDEALAHYNATLPRLQEFILPAGTRSASLAHVSRTVARRAERAVVALAGGRAGERRAAPVPEPAVATCCSCWRACSTAPTSTAWAATTSTGLTDSAHAAAPPSTGASQKTARAQSAQYRPEKPIRWQP